MKTPKEHLIELLRQNRVIPVVGAGASFNVAGLPGWAGTVEDGFTFAEIRRLDAGTIATGRNLLAEGRLTEAASLLKALLRSPGFPFSNWLDELFSNPAVKDPALMHSINDLCAPAILTTNYDNLLYSISKLKTYEVYDWMEYQEVDRALAGEKKFILHLHGIVSKPPSIILSSDDYSELARQEGYKEILKRLWTGYHFLFIGCSRDGVMDEDFSTVFSFLNQWFPSRTHQHFILMHESDLEKGLHIKLLEQANVEAISFGTDYDKLAAFIDEINPNADRSLLELEALKAAINDRVQRLHLSDGSINTAPAVIDKLVKESLPGGIHWIDSLQLQFLEASFKNLNQEISGKRQKFELYQNVVRALVDISKLREKRSLWTKNSDHPATLNNSDYIGFATLCYECLQRMPPDVLEEIRHREPSAIHDYYYSGYLGRFIREYQSYASYPNSALLQTYDDDAYFFENLNRIVSSLQGVLEIDPGRMYKALPVAKIAPVVEPPLLLFVTSTEISIRQTAYPYDITAAVYAEPAVPFRGAELHYLQDRNVVIGYTSQKCFRWDPIKDLAPEFFFSAAPKEHIRQLMIDRSEEGLLIFIYAGRSIHTIKDLKQAAVQKLRQNLTQLAWYKPGKRMYGLREALTGDLGPVLFEIGDDGRNRDLLSTTDLLQIALQSPFVRDAVEKENKLNGNGEFFSHLYPFIITEALTAENWMEEDVLVLKARLNFFQENCSLLVFLRIRDEKVEVITSIVIPGKTCAAYDTIRNGDRIDLALGYLATGAYPTHLVQVIHGIDQGPFFEVGDQDQYLPSDGYAHSDVYRIAADANRLFIIQNAKTLYELELPGGACKQIGCSDLRKLIPY